MFNVKFVRTQDGCTQWNCIHCPHYIIEKTENRITIVVYKDLHDKEGVERHIYFDENMDGTDHYDACFIENIAGKTIDHYTRIK